MGKRKATTYTLHRHDDIPPTHALCEKYLSAREIRQAGGYVFIPLGLAAKMPAPDDEVTLGGHPFPAWRLTPRAA